VRRLMASFGREADWERLSGNMIIDAAKLRNLGWDPRVAAREGLARMMRGPMNGANAG
jgi:nucleoside-diphosphate-sugar epimerase